MKTFLALVNQTAAGANGPTTPTTLRARRASNHHILVFSHHPLFLSRPDEEDSWAVIPIKRRRILLDLFKETGVSAVFSGHWHRNGFATYGDMELITTGPVGYPLGDDPSGFRIVRVREDELEHEYIPLDTG